MAKLRRFLHGLAQGGQFASDFLLRQYLLNQQNENYLDRQSELKDQEHQYELEQAVREGWADLEREAASGTLTADEWRRRVQAFASQHGMQLPTEPTPEQAPDLVGATRSPSGAEAGVSGVVRDQAGPTADRYRANRPSDQELLDRIADEELGGATAAKDLVGAEGRIRRRTSRMGIEDDDAIAQMIAGIPELQQEFYGDTHSMAAAGRAPVAVPGVDPETNAPTVRYASPDTLAASGEVNTTGRTAEQTADFTLRSEQDPALVASRVAEAGQTAGAQERARLAQQLAQIGLTSQQQQAALALADDFDRASGPFNERQQAFQTVAALSQRPSAANDIALVFSYMKTIDPGSTVREGEAATVRNAAGIPERIRNQYNRLMTGESLSPEQRADFVQSVAEIYQGAVQEQQKLIATYRDRARQLGVPETLVIREPTVEPSEALQLLRQRGGAP